MLTWPRSLLNPHEERWRLVGSAITGGQSVSGITQSVSSTGGGFWMVDAEFSLGTKDKIRAWRAWEAILDGGSVRSRAAC